MLLNMKQQKAYGYVISENNSVKLLNARCDMYKNIIDHETKEKRQRYKSNLV